MMGQPRKFANEVELKEFMESTPPYYYFPIDPDKGCISSGPLTDLLALKNIKIVNNGTRTYSTTGFEKLGFFFVINERGDILGEISKQLLIAQVSKYSYYSYKLHKDITIEIGPLEKSAEKKKNETSKKPKNNKRKLAPIVVPDDVKVINPIDVAIDQMAAIDPYYKLSQVMMALEFTLSQYDTSKNPTELIYLIYLLPGAIQLAEESFNAKINELNVFTMLTQASSMDLAVRAHIDGLHAVINKITTTSKQLSSIAVQINTELELMKLSSGLEVPASPATRTPTSADLPTPTLPSSPSMPSPAPLSAASSTPSSSSPRAYASPQPFTFFSPPEQEKEPEEVFSTPQPVDEIEREITSYFK